MNSKSSHFSEEWFIPTEIFLKKIYSSVSNSVSRAQGFFVLSLFVSVFVFNVEGFPWISSGNTQLSHHIWVRLCKAKWKFSVLGGVCLTGRFHHTVRRQWGSLSNGGSQKVNIWRSLFWGSSESQEKSSIAFQSSEDEWGMGIRIPPFCAIDFHWLPYFQPRFFIYLLFA